MRNLFCLIILTFCFYSCGSSPNQVEIKGEIKGLNNDTIYLYGTDELSNLHDTIIVTNNKLSHVIPMDTLIQVMMLIDNKYEYPLYLDKKRVVTIKGDLSQDDFLEIKGVHPNEELTSFYKSMKDVGMQPDSIKKRVESYIYQNQSSLVSIYLLDKYFVQEEKPDVARIRRLISYMDGTLQDKPYIEKLNKLLEENEKGEVGKTALSFALPNAKGEIINRTKYRNQYLLLSFWASWCDSCRTSNAELKDVYSTNKDHSKFAMLGISLDLDKNQWLETIRKDTLEWEQLCDFSGWENNVAKQYSVYTIPYTILLGTDGRVLARDIKGQALVDKLKELLKEEEKSKNKKKK